MEKLNKNIKIIENERKIHSKALEEYVHCEFAYSIKNWNGWVPVEYRRTGVSIKPEDTAHLISYLNMVYEQMKPENFSDWKKKQDEFWKEKSKAEKTKEFFDSLIKGSWQCVECTLPKNPNWARRIQDLKEFGYTLATDTKRYCPICKANKTHIMLLPIERGSITGNGYETWSLSLRKRIIKVLGGIDVYEGTSNAHCLPDHKFPEVRWDENTKSENPDNMTDNEIKQKFQLLTNQRNQQKREICRKCFQTGKRGTIYGIDYFYKGTTDWDVSIPCKGKGAERGCVGCPWYDIAEWKRHLVEQLGNKKSLNIKTVGSICSGIEAASVAWQPLGFEFQWFSEIADFPSKVLLEKYPQIPNLGNMNDIPSLIENNEISFPDLLCAGTPCQAFSLAGCKNGLKDDRGNLTLKFVDIVEANDRKRISQGKEQSIIFWENVEGVLADKTNAFGFLVSSLAGFTDVIEVKKWPNAGIIRGPKRNIAWRVLDAKFFGIPQQRKRLYVLAGGTDFYPENVLFEMHSNELMQYPKGELCFEKDGHKFEVFREYTDCLYSAYGTKWNGNAAAYNGSLFVVQDDKLRRLSPLECERLMGFPDKYTDLLGAKKTNRYQATGNSWVVPVIEWIGKRLILYESDKMHFSSNNVRLINRVISWEEGFFIDCGKDMIEIDDEIIINCTNVPENCKFGSMRDIISADAPEDIYISPVGCYGIIRRKKERNLKINPRLEQVLWSISSQMTLEEIENKSKVQKRGKFSEM